MIFTSFDEHGRLVKVGDRVYYNRFYTTGRHRKGSPEDTGRLFLSVDLGENINHVCTLPFYRDDIGTKLDIISISIVDKNGDVKLGSVEYRFDLNSGELNTEYKWGNNAYEYFKLAEESIKKIYGNNVAYVVMSGGSGYFVFTKDGHVEFYNILGTGEQTHPRFEFVKGKRNLPRNVYPSETTQYLMISSGNAWIEKHGQHYLVSKLSKPNKIMTYRLQNEEGEELFSKDTEFWYYTGRKNFLFTNKAYLRFDNNYMCFYIRWNNISDVILKEGIKKIVDKSTSSSDKHMYILTKKNNLYKAEIKGRDDLVVSELIRENVKDVYELAHITRLGLTTDGIIFDYSSGTPVDIVDDIENLFVVGDLIVGNITTTGFTSLKERIEEIEKAIKDYNGIKDMPDLLSKMIPQTNSYTTTMHTSRVYAYMYGVGLKRNGRFSLFINAGSSDEWCVIDDMFPTKILDGIDYVTRETMCRPVTSLLDLC